MPTRLLREGINRSRTVAKLSEEAELFYRRLMSVVDDYGRCEDDPEVLLLGCFPFRLDTWNVERVSKCITDVTQMPYTWVADDKQVYGKLVTAYSVAGRKYLQINNFNQPKRSKPKCPGPPLHSSCVADALKTTRSTDTDTDTKERIRKNGYERTDTDSAEIGFAEGLPDDAFEQILAAYPRKQASARAEFRNVVAGFESNSAAAKSWFAGVLAAAKVCAKFPASKRAYLPNLGKFISAAWEDDWESELVIATLAVKGTASEAHYPLVHEDA